MWCVRSERVQLFSSLEDRNESGHEWQRWQQREEETCGGLRYLYKGFHDGDDEIVCRGGKGGWQPQPVTLCWDDGSLCEINDGTKKDSGGCYILVGLSTFSGVYVSIVMCFFVFLLSVVTYKLWTLVFEHFYLLPLSTLVQKIINLNIIWWRPSMLLQEVSYVMLPFRWNSCTLFTSHYQQPWTRVLSCVLFYSFWANTCKIYLF